MHPIALLASNPNDPLNRIKIRLCPRPIRLQNRELLPTLTLAMSDSMAEVAEIRVEGLQRSEFPCFPRMLSRGWEFICGVTLGLGGGAVGGFCRLGRDSPGAGERVADRLGVLWKRGVRSLGWLVGLGDLEGVLCVSSLHDGVV